MRRSLMPEKYRFKCSDVGMNCGFQVRGAGSQEEVLEIVKVHAQTAHNMSNVEQQTLDKIKSQIKKEGRFMGIF